MADRSLQEVFQWSRQLAELAKDVRWFCVVAELLAASVGIAAAASSVDLGFVGPVLATVLVFAAAGGRKYAGSMRSIAESCRMEVIRAHAHASSISPLFVATTRQALPPAALLSCAARRLKAPSVDQYYDTPLPPGELRERQMYAESAFYTWPVLRYYSSLSAALFVLVAVITFLVLTQAYAQADNVAPSRIVVESLYSFVLGVLAVKALETSWQAQSTAQEIEGIAKSLLTRPRPTGSDLAALTRQYDLAVSAGPAPPSWLYQVLYSKLKAGWDDVRQIQ
jgi:hypothetical protein